SISPATIPTKDVEAAANYSPVPLLQPNPLAIAQAIHPRKCQFQLASNLKAVIPLQEKPEKCSGWLHAGQH
ncbi:hypothetical protein L3056_10865, partial [Corynebacterium sp. MC-25]|nr:hypothetical protein [Corynebacterium parakroppenstedtii]